MPTKRRIPPTNPREYATQGTVYAKADTTNQAVALEVHHCTAYCTQSETLMITLQLIHAGYALFGSDFTRGVQTYLEQLEG